MHYTSLLEHLNLRYKKFEKVTQYTMSDAAVQMKENGYFEYVKRLNFGVPYTVVEPPAELLWMLKFDEKVY